ncbi:EscN/YscN/HrcN family type III secretion system ATPase, partial [Paraburkholderia sp. Se-20369]|nr:EscN/YscN/HrcN family type III secretion system ATPase [Paraburkholderia sp. Se-20369]
MAARLAMEPAVGMTGKVLEVIGTIVRVVGLEATLGELCELRSASGVLIQHAEVVGFTRNVAL